MQIDISTVPHNTLIKIPHSYYQDNRKRLIDGLKKQRKEEDKEFPEKGLIFMKGHTQHMNNHDDDATANWKQEPNFAYLFGFTDYFHLYALIDVATGETIVSLPEVDEVSKVFESNLTLESNPEDFGVDKFISEDILEVFIAKRCPDEIFIYDGINRFEVASHQPTFKWLSDYK